jgi:formate hydrogenlyase transcriptional activator
MEKSKTTIQSDSNFQAITSVMEEMPFGVVIHDMEGKILYVNNYVPKKLEYPREVIEGSFLHKFIVFDTRDPNYDVGINGHIIHERFFTQSGVSFIAEVHLRSICLNNQKLQCGMFVDISEVEALRGENLRLQNIIKNHLDRVEHSVPRRGPLAFTDRHIIGRGAGMNKVVKMISQVAMTPYTVLILGETGTGKELVAEATHLLSDRKDKTLVKLNCAALPPNLIETELFGYEKGAFTGATERKIGKFEVAHQGTIFLDEIGEMSLDLQTKLLRVMQEKEFERVVETALCIAMSVLLPQQMSA